MVKRAIALAISFCLFFEQTGFAQVAPQITIPAYLNGYVAADRFRPLHLRSLTFDQAHDSFKLFLDKGDVQKIEFPQVEKTTKTLMEYFQLGLRLPNSMFWVNLRPDSAKEIIDPYLEQTDLGKVLLEADLQLKKDMAAFTSPQTAEGRQYWDRLYAKAEELFGDSDVSVPTLTRPWIVPGEIIMRQSQDSAYVYKASLNVMLEQDYIKDSSAYNFDDPRMKVLNEYSSELIRTLVLPKLTREVNSSKKYAALRQVYYSLVLAQWFKQKYGAQKETSALVASIDNKDLAGLTSQKKWSKDKYFKSYQKSFTGGEYNISEGVQTTTGLVIRQYFSGGMDFARKFLPVSSNPLAAGTAGMLIQTQLTPTVPQDPSLLAADFGPAGVTVAAQPQPAAALADGGTGTDEAAKPSVLSDVRAALERRWVLANHLFMAFHVAFVSSVLSLPAGEAFNYLQVLQFMFASPETPISAAFLYLTWHTAIALHEMGHYLKAVKTAALKPELLKDAQEKMNQPFFKRLAWYAEMFVKIPWGKFEGVVKAAPAPEAKGTIARTGEKIWNFFIASFYPDAPFNLAVSAEGPAFSFKVARVVLPIAISLVAGGLILKGMTGDIASMGEGVLYAGRMLLGIGIVTLLDRIEADPGKYREFQEREKKAAEKAKEVQAKMTGEVKPWKERMPEVMAWMLSHRIQEGTLNGMPIRAPYGWRNSGMGGRHTEKEYPKSNISMQELMFIPLTAKTYEEAQQITVELQNRLMQIIEKAEGATVMGIGLEGGLATYIQKEKGDKIPERRLWRMAKQAIIDIGKIPGVDVVLGIDPADSELEIAYREKFKQPDAVGMYLFWRDEDQTVMSRDELADEIAAAIEEDIPIISGEDLFAEDDYEGWRNWMARYGHMMFVIADDIATTRDSTVEMIGDEGLANTLLVKANQIGTLSETELAGLTARGKKMFLVVSHRSKSPNDDMEAQVAISFDAEGIKAGGGANTERLVKYGAIIKMMKEAIRQKAQGPQMADQALEDLALQLIPQLQITRIIAYEEATNAGIPTVGVKVSIGVPGSKMFENLMEFTGSTPLGTSAGTGEAIHLVDSIIQPSELTQKYADLFTQQPDKTFKFKKDVNDAVIQSKNDAALTALFIQAQRYGGKGTQNAVVNVEQILSKLFVGKKVSEINSIFQIDQMLLNAELETGIQRGKINKDASAAEKIAFMQRKGELGMNAILSMSLALGRMAAAVQGKELWQLMREEMSQTIAAVIAESEGKTKDQVLKENTYAQLVEKLKTFEEQRKARADQKKLYEYLREGLPVYAAASADGGKKTKGDQFPGAKYSGMSDLLAKIEGAIRKSDTKTVEKLHADLLLVQQDAIAVSFASQGYSVLSNPVPTLGQALAMVDAFQKTKIPNILTGFQVGVSFEDAKKGLEDNDFIAALVEVSKFGDISNRGSMMVLYPTTQGLEKIFNDPALKKKFLSNADGGWADPGEISNILKEIINKINNPEFRGEGAKISEFLQEYAGAVEKYFKDQEAILQREGKGADSSINVYAEFTKTVIQPVRFYDVSRPAFLDIAKGTMSGERARGLLEQEKAIFLSPVWLSSHDSLTELINLLDIVQDNWKKEHNKDEYSLMAGDKSSPPAFQEALLGMRGTNLMQLATIEGLLGRPLSKTEITLFRTTEGWRLLYQAVELTIKNKIPIWDIEEKLRSDYFFADVVELQYLNEQARRAVKNELDPFVVRLTGQILTQQEKIFLSNLTAFAISGSPLQLKEANNLLLQIRESRQIIAWLGEGAVILKPEDFDSAIKGLNGGLYTARLYAGEDSKPLFLILYDTDKGLRARYQNEQAAGSGMDKAEIYALLEKAFSDRWSKASGYGVSSLKDFVNFNSIVIPLLSKILKDGIDVEIAAGLLFDRIKVEVTAVDGQYIRSEVRHPDAVYSVTKFDVAGAMALVNDPAELRRQIDAQRSASDGGSIKTVLSKEAEARFIESFMKTKLSEPDAPFSKQVSDSFTRGQARIALQKLIVPFVEKADELFAESYYQSEYPSYVATMPVKDNMEFVFRTWTYQELGRIPGADHFKYYTKKGREKGIGAFSNTRTLWVGKKAETAHVWFDRLLQLIPVGDNNNFHIEFVRGDSREVMIEKTIASLQKEGIAFEGLSGFLAATDGGNLSKVSGLDINYNANYDQADPVATMLEVKNLFLGDTDAQGNPDWRRPLQDLVPSNRNPELITDANKGRLVYYGYRHVAEKTDVITIEKNGLRGDITVLMPGIIDENDPEFIMTKGHHQAVTEANPEWAYPELYEVW
ncbi:MAG: hypothetical protein PHT59_01450, partial [Candidatus Omnitrophica bacterium]|nr:hypothetical protein [Candidatus Omnitrophota bacterium]